MWVLQPSSSLSNYLGSSIPFAFPYIFFNQLASFYKNMKTLWNFDNGCIESVDKFGQNWHVKNTEYSFTKLNAYLFYSKYFMFGDSYKWFIYHKNTIDCCMLTLNPATLIDSFNDTNKYFVELWEKACNFLVDHHVTWE